MNSTNEQKEDLSNIFAQVKDIDDQACSLIIEMLRNEKIQNCLEYLSNKENEKKYEQYIIQVDNLTLTDNLQKFNTVRNNIKIITNVLKQITDHDLYYIDYSLEISLETKQDLIKKLTEENQIQFLKFLVHLTSINNQFIQCGSNAINLLVQMKADLTKQSFENIKIKNTSVVGGNFAKCNLSGSEFENVQISGINLNGAQLFNCNGRTQKYLSVCGILRQDNKNLGCKIIVMLYQQFTSLLMVWSLNKIKLIYHQ